MNIIEVLYFAAYSVKHGVFDSLRFFRGIFWLALRLAKVGLQSIVVLPLGLVLDICGDLLRLSLTLACISTVVILISLIKSLKPRYNFYHDPADSSTSSDDFGSDPNAIQHRNDIFSPSTKRTKSASSGWPIKRYIEKQFPFAQQLWSRLKDESHSLNQVCSPALSVPDIESVYKGLSWSHTQVDIESVNWLNQTFRTLWPSIKSLLNIFLFNDLLKPKEGGKKGLANESKKLSRLKPKLSVYISSRRKLDLLRQIEANALSSCQNGVDKSLFRAIFYILKLMIIYIKQFIIDYSSYLFKKARKKPTSDRGFGKFDVDFDKLLAEKRGVKQATAKQVRNSTKSWAGFDVSTGNRPRDERLRGIRERKSRTAPPRIARARMAQGMLGPRGMSKLHERRLKLADRFRKAYNETKKNELTIERIRLGDSIPMINGLKYIDERNDLMIDPIRTSRHLVGSDERNMRFVSELSYASDKKFQIKLSLHPILGQIRLINLKAQIRCYISLNHTINELNRDLKIFDTPDDVLFPAINYVQLSLVDVPSFDWTLDRPNANKLTERGKRKRSAISKYMSNYKSKLFDPVHIINHPYFKYIVHSIIYVGLKWFQPFDIRIGQHLYLKTIC